VHYPAKQGSNCTPACTPRAAASLLTCRGSHSGCCGCSPAMAARLGGRAAEATRMMRSADASAMPAARLHSIRWQLRRPPSRSPTLFIHIYVCDGSVRGRTRSKRLSCGHFCNGRVVIRGELQCNECIRPALHNHLVCIVKTRLKSTQITSLPLHLPSKRLIFDSSTCHLHSVLLYTSLVAAASSDSLSQQNASKKASTSHPALHAQANGTALWSHLLLITLAPAVAPQQHTRKCGW